jgi:MOSC domain-containing protein YiiM
MPQSTQPSSQPALSGTLVSIQIGQVRPLMVGGRKLVSGIGKTTVSGPIDLGVLGLAGDEQSDLSVHGGLSKAVYALPSEHLAWWQAQRQVRGATMFEEALAPGCLGENLSLQGVLEQDLFVGDRLDFGDVVLRVTQPREPCGKFNAVMGYSQAAKDMVQSGRCGFYLAVEQTGRLRAGASFQVIPGQRSVSMAQALQHKAWKHLR